MPPVVTRLQPVALLVPVVLLLAGASTARAATAPPSAAGVVEIARPGRGWVPDGYRATPESDRLGALRAGGLAPAEAPAAVRPGAGFGEDLDAAAARRHAARAAWAEFAARPALRADVVWDARTGMPHRVRVAGLRAASRRLETAAAAEAAARDLVRREASLLTGGETPGPAEMPLVKARRVGDVWLLVFGQRYRGFEVLDGRVDVRLRVDGSVPVIGSGWCAGIDVATEPRVHRSAAEAVARVGVGFADGRDRERGSDLVVLPVPAGDGVGYRLAHRVRLAVQDPPGVWATYVDAADGRVWARENELRHLEVGGTVLGYILPVTYTDPQVQRPFRFALVWHPGDSTYADAAGAYRLPGTTAGEPIYAELRAPFVAVVNQAGSSVRLFGLAPAADPLPFVFSPAAGDTAERNGFYQTLAVHDYVKDLDPGFTALDFPLPCNVNINATCNAYWDGASINFYRYGGGCANTANIADVIFHEYGHGVTQFTFAPFDANGGMHEGFSDYLAATMTRQPLVGIGFRGPGTYLRSVENAVALPAPECGGKVHCLGTAVSGALWDLQQSFIAALGDSGAARAKADSLWHYAGYGGAYWYDDYLVDLLVVDDDDGTLVNGTPHYADICAAFEAHGFHCPEAASGAWIAHAPLGDADSSPAPFAVVAEMGSTTSGLAPLAQRLFFRLHSGPWEEAPMGPAEGSTFVAAIPALPAGGRVDYYLENRDADGSVATSPPGAPAAAHTFHVGALETVHADDFETGNHGWTANAGNTAVSGFWELIDPHGTASDGYPFQPEDDHTPYPGAICWVTGDTTAAFPPPAGADDVDGGCVHLVSPAWDLSALDNARLEYWRWYTDETSLDDTLHVEISADGGVTWLPLEEQLFTQNAWRKLSFDLGSRVPLTSQFRLRLRACDLGGGSLTEAALDDIAVTTRRSALVAADRPPPPRVLALRAAVPNPTRSATAIAFDVPGAAGAAAQAVTLGLYDARGRRVRTLVRGVLPPGSHTVRWDGRDASGRAVAAGTYLCRLEAEGRLLTGKVVVLP